MGQWLDRVRGVGTQPDSRPWSERVADGLEPSTSETFFDLMAPSEFGTSFRPDIRQRAAERSARTELTNLQREFRSRGKMEDFQEFAASKGRVHPFSPIDLTLTDVLTPAFDLLQIGQHTTAGLALEALRTGSVWEGFKQAAVEFGNSLPGIEVAGARRPSWQNVLEEAGVSKWGAWTGGLALDILLDPVMLIPGGALLKPALAGGRAAVRRSGSAGRLWEMLFRPRRELAPLGGQVREAVMGHLGRAEAAISNESLAMLDRVDRMIGWMQPHERVLFNLWMDQPKLLERELNQAVSSGLLDSSRVPKLMEQAAEINGALKGGRISFTEELFQKETNIGIIDQSMHRAFYVHGAEAADPRARRAWQKAGRERSVSGISGSLPIGKKFPAAFPRTTENQLDRFTKALSGEIEVIPELDIGNTLAKRGIDHVRWTTWRKFLDAIVSDGRISARVDSEIPKEFWANPFEWEKWKADLRKQKPGYDVLEVKQKTRSPLRDDPTKLGPATEKVIGAWVLPEPVVSLVSRAQATLSGSGDTVDFLGGIDKFTDIWRGWATFGIGYHARNEISNSFMLWLSGVGNDYKEVLKGRWPFDRGSYALRRLQALRLQVAAEGAGRLPRKVKEVADRLALSIGQDGLLAIKLPKIVHNGKVLDTWEEIARVGEAYGVPQIATELHNVPALFEQKLWTSLEPSVDLGAVMSSSLDPMSKRALELARGGPRTTREKLNAWLGPNMPVLRAHRTFGQMMENNSRWTLFLDRMAKGSDAAEAASASKTWIFDYRNLTEVERRVFRVLSPFYAWTRFAVSRMLFAMLENPGRFAKVPKMKDALERLSPEWKGIPTPDYFDEVQAVQLPAARRNRPLFAQLDLPVQELNKLNYNDVLSSLHPIIKLVGESVPSGGHSFFLGAPIESFPGEPSEGIPFLGKQVEAQIGTIFPPIGKFISRPAKAAARGELAEQIFSEFAGVRLRPLDVRRVLRGRLFEQRKLAKEFKKRLEEGLE